MHQTFFIGDTHFGHKNVLKYEPYHRPWITIEEHNEALIDRWNKKVGPQDTVMHLGDFCFGLKNVAIAGRLNGKKRLIMGNHDVYPAAEYLKYFNSLHGALHYKSFLLTHIPVHEDTAKNITNIHGHLHSNVRPEPWYINVSCEQIDCTPISLDEIWAKYGKETS